MSSFVDGFCIQLNEKLNIEQLNIVKEQLEKYTMGFEIHPISKSNDCDEYSLPSELFLYLKIKQQDGKMSQRSYEQYYGCLSKMLLDIRMPLKDITVNHLRIHLSNISINKYNGKPLSLNTLAQRKSIIRSFFQWLYEEEFISKDPSVRIKSTRSDSKPREAYQDVQIEALRNACKTDRDLALVDLLTSSGIRVEECSRLNINDVDLENREIKVLGKGDKYRTSYINARTVVSLQKYLDSRKDNEPALFLSLRNKNRIKPGGIRKMLHGLEPNVSAGNIIPHRFRHTMATTAISNGMPIESVQSILGHAELSTTMRYAHVSKLKVKHDHAMYMR